MAGGVWENELGRLLDRHRRRLQSVLRQTAATREKVSRINKELERDEEALKRELKWFETESEKLLARRDDPEVVVRSYGKTQLYTYHADTNCGWAPMRYERILLSQAKDLGYHACASCGYRVPKKRAA